MFQYIVSGANFYNCRNFQPSNPKNEFFRKFFLTLKNRNNVCGFQLLQLLRTEVKDLWSSMLLMVQKMQFAVDFNFYTVKIIFLELYSD